MVPTSQYTDILMQKIELNDIVTVPRGRYLYVGKVIDFTPQMVRVELFPPAFKQVLLRYPCDLMRLSPEDGTFYLLARK